MRPVLASLRAALRGALRPAPALASAGLLGAALVPAARGEAAELDWCAPVVVRADQRWLSTAACEPWWKPDTIARDADFVLGGFNVPTASTLSRPDVTACFGVNGHESSRIFHQDLRARAAALGRTLTILLMARFDLVNRAEASTPGFDAGFLVRSARPWSETTDFFRLDTTPTCACGCAWSDAPGAAFANDPPGERMRDFIDASAGPGDYQSRVFYGIRANTGGSLEGAPRRFFASSALADQTHPGYRAWKVGLMQDALANGDFDGVILNHKLFQYLWSEDPYWWGGPRAPDVETYLTADAPWSAPILGYAYPEYVRGWAALAVDLAAAGVPYAVEASPFLWRADSVYDDPSTPAADEREILRQVARDADWVFLLRAPQLGQAEWDAIVADVESGGAQVVPVDLACGFGGPDAPETPPPDLVASVVAAPNVAAVSSYAAGALTVRPLGAAAGAWDAELWCDCPSPPCGPPDAATAGETGATWQPPSGLCDAVYTQAARPYRARARITRAGFSAEGTDLVTICAPACSDGADNDGDGLFDHPSDPGCAGPGAVYEHPACDDGRDNDGDGAVDHPADPGCDGRSDAGERSALLPCDDGVDNDGDGLTDFGSDPGCLGPGGREDPQCDDGVDNDGDGAVDWDGGGAGPPDPDCTAASDARERRARGCGAGAEALLLVAPFARWRARRRSRAS